MHTSVLLKEVIDNLDIKENGTYVDCTLGYAGHSSEILKRINKGLLFAFDQDEEAIEYSRSRLKAIGNNFEVIKSNFINLKDELKRRNITKVDGILFDLGVSSPQLDNALRGFSYHQDAKLDMRMDKSSNLSAYELVNTYPYDKLVEIFFKYGEEKYAKSIAKSIVSYRVTKKIETTLELVDIIVNSVPQKYRRETHPARRVFQAIRIEVNKEIEVLEKSLEDAISLLKKDGRLCVITFHSLEDKICKHIFKKHSDIKPELVRLPSVPDEFKPILKVIGKFEPSKEEIEANNRSRSATLRVVVRL